MNASYLLIFLVLLLCTNILLNSIRSWLDSFKEGLTSVLEAIRKLAGNAARCARNLICLENLSLEAAILRAIIAILLVTLGTGMAYSEFQVLIETIGYMLGLTTPESNNADPLDLIICLATVISGSVFALPLTDLMGWTSVTRFARIEKGRVAAFEILLTFFILALINLTAIGVIRAGGVLFEVIDADGLYGLMKVIDYLRGFVLVSLSILFFLATAICLLHLEEFFQVLACLCLLTFAAMTLVMDYLLRGIRFVVTMAIQFVDQLKNGWDSTVACVRKKRQNPLVPIVGNVTQFDSGSKKQNKDASNG